MRNENTTESLSNEQRAQIKAKVVGELSELGRIFAAKTKVKTSSENLYLSLGLIQVKPAHFNRVRWDSFPEGNKQSLLSEVRKIVQGPNDTRSIDDNELRFIICNIILKMAEESKNKRKRSHVWENLDLNTKLEIKRCIRLGLLKEGRKGMGEQNEISSEYKVLNHLIRGLNGEIDQALVNEVKTQLKLSSENISSLFEGAEENLKKQIRDETIILKKQLLDAKNTLFWPKVGAVTMAAFFGATAAQAIFPRCNIPIISSVVGLLQPLSPLAQTAIACCSLLAIGLSIKSAFFVEPKVQPILLDKYIEASMPHCVPVR